MDTKATEATVPEPLTMEVHGCTITVTYRRTYEYDLCARIEIPEPFMRFAAEIADIPIHPDVSYYDRTYVVIDGDGSEVVDSLWPHYLIAEYRRYERERRQVQTETDFTEELAELQAAADALRPLGLYTTAVQSALLDCALAIRKVSWSYRSPDYSSVAAQLRRIGRLIAELSGPFMEVVVHGLLNGPLWHRDLSSNDEIRKRQLMLWLRSGGNSIIELITDDALGSFYRERLKAAGVTTMNEVHKVPLALNEDDYLPRWLLTEPDLNLAPEMIIISGPGDEVGEGEVLHVAYGFRANGDEHVRTGTVKMSLRNYKRATHIPTLPHRIELIFELTVSNQVVVRGVRGTELDGRIKKYEGGRRRASNAPPADLYRHAPVAAGEVPPWRVGCPVRWR